MILEKNVFSNEALIYWRNVLEKRKKIALEAEASIQRHANDDLSPEKTGEISKVRLHSGDLATDTQEIETLEALSDKKMKNLNDIDDALIRIDKGTFGLCLDCGDSISYERLKAIPEARFCVDCQNEFEKMQKTVAENKFPPNSLLPHDLLQSTIDLGKIKVGAIMQENPITVHFNDNLNTAVDILIDKKSRHLPVINDQNELQGLLSDRDWIRLIQSSIPSIYSEKLNKIWLKIKVNQIMTKNPKTVSMSTDLKEVGTLILDNKIGCVPVVENNQLMGIITESDFVKLVTHGLTENA